MPIIQMQTIYERIYMSNFVHLMYLPRFHSVCLCLCAIEQENERTRNIFVPQQKLSSKQDSANTNG